MIIDCISDLHGHYPHLDGGDLLIVAGDLTGTDSAREHEKFYDWCITQEYRKIVLIAGNHDNYLFNQIGYPFSETPCVELLSDSGCEFEGLKIWGSPWTSRFEGMNPSCMAFTCDTEEELEKKWALIPDDVDILVTHSPPNGISDMVKDSWEGRIANVGSKKLLHRVKKIKPKLHVFGHVHEGYGIDTLEWGLDPNKQTIFVNASHVNEYYQPVNKPVRIIL